MPLYDVRCLEDCGYFHDILVVRGERNSIACPSCEGETEHVLRGVAVVGPMPSKPLVLSQINQSFDSATQWRKFQRDNPDFAVVPNGGAKWREHKDNVRNFANKRCKNAGFNDLEDRQKRMKVRDDDMKRIAKEGTKPFVAG